MCVEFEDVEWFGYDMEMLGVIGDWYFEVLCLVVCVKGFDYLWVWGWDVFLCFEMLELF